MWDRQSHVFQELTKLMSDSVKFRRTSVEQDAFDETKYIEAKYVLQAYTAFNKRFDKHIDASQYQLGALHTQEGKPISFYSRNITCPQTR